MISVIRYFECEACDGSVVHVLDAACVILLSLFLLEMANMVKKQGTTQQDGLDYAFVKQQQRVL